MSGACQEIFFFQNWVFRSVRRHEYLFFLHTYHTTDEHSARHTRHTPHTIHTTLSFVVLTQFDICLCETRFQLASICGDCAFPCSRQALTSSSVYTDGPCRHFSRTCDWNTFAQRVGPLPLFAVRERRVRHQRSVRYEYF